MGVPQAQCVKSFSLADVGLTALFKTLVIFACSHFGKQRAFEISEPSGLLNRAASRGVVSSSSSIQVFDVATPRRGSRRALPASIPARIVVTGDVRNFASFWPRSSKLGEARCYVFQCAEVVTLQCDAFASVHKSEPLLVAILNSNDEPLVLLPLCIEHCHDPSSAVMNVRILKFLEGGLSDYNAPVIFPATADWDTRTVRKVWGGLRKALPAFDIAVFEKMPEHVGDLPNPLRLLRTMAREQRSGHTIDLAGSGGTLAKQLLDDRRMERKVRKLSEIGQLTFEMARTPEQYDVFMDALFRQKNRRDLELRGREPLKAPFYRAYLSMARRHLYPSGPVCLFALRHNNVIVATAFCEASGQRLISLTSSFEGGEWRKYSLGHILKHKIVQWCLTEGISVMDLGGGDEKWKDDYHTVAVALYRIVISSSIRGAVFLHAPKSLQRIHRRRTESWREMELAESACSNPAETSNALAHARKSWTLWPSPRRTREFFKVAKHIRSMKSRKAI